MNFRKIIPILLSICLASAILFSPPQPVRADGAKGGRFIAIVYDDSGSMRYQNKKDVLKNYIYANYSLQNLIALMDDRDTAKVFLISKKGKKSIAVSRHKDLYNDFKSVGAVTKGDTYIETVDAAFRAGATYLKANVNNDFLFVLVTDGDTMNDADGKEITGPLKARFDDYLKNAGLSDQGGRMSALLLSIGTSRPLSPVADLQSALEHVGVRTETFTADVTDENTAGERIMTAMNDLAEAMASTNMMVITPGQPFVVRYPLESLVIMEQFQKTSESMITGIAGQDGKPLNRETLFSTRALQGVKLASTFSSIKSATGPVKPGSYTLSAAGDVKLIAFSKISFQARITLKDASGKAVAEYSGNRWNTGSLALTAGDTLTANVKFVALDGAAVDMGSHVTVGFGNPACLSCETKEPGVFTVKAVSAGHDHLAINLVDPEYFQLAIPALAVTVQSAGSQQSPQPSATPTPNASGTPTQPSESVGDGTITGEALFDWEAIDSLSKTPVSVTYTSSKDYIEAAAPIELAGKSTGDHTARFTAAIPKGLEVRFNDASFDEHSQAGKITLAPSNTIHLLANDAFVASGDLLLKMVFDNNQIITIPVVVKPRNLKLTVQPDQLEVGVLSGGQTAPSCTVAAQIGSGDQWQDADLSALHVKVMAPAGLEARLERGHVTVRPGWMPVLVPIGSQAVAVHVETGKPGESADATLTVLVRDNGLKWLIVGMPALLLIIIAAYVALLAVKKRIPLQMEAYVSTSSDLADAQPVALARKRLRRDFWPFGREVCEVGLLEIYPCAGHKERLVLSSECVQYGLRIDGKPPQFHKAKDGIGDYIIDGNNIVAVRENGAYRYYRFVYAGKVGK